MSRVYSAEELALFARYVPARADHRPAGCNYAAECWVEVGPPGLSKAVCRGCGCSIANPGYNSNPTGKNRYTQ